MSKVGAKPRWRTTIVVEYETQADLEEGLAHGFQCARERYIGIRFGLKDKDSHGPKIEVRTAKMRPRKAGDSNGRSGGERDK